MSEETRQQSQAMVDLARGLYADEHNPRGAIEALARAVRLNPANAEAHLLLGQVYGERGLYHEAEPSLRRAATLFASDTGTDERNRARLAEARNSLAACLINLGRHDEAIGLLRQVVAEVLYPAPHLAWGNLGLALLRKGEPRRAVEALDRAVTIQPQFCVGLFRLGEAYHRLDDYGRALDALDRALAVPVQGCNEIQGAYSLRGQVHIRLHQPEAARTDLQRCVELAPRSPEGVECATLSRSVAAGP